VEVLAIGPTRTAVHSQMLVPVATSGRDTPLVGRVIVLQTKTACSTSLPQTALALPRRDPNAEYVRSCALAAYRDGSTLPDPRPKVPHLIDTYV
jgi:hypothetical protein